MSKPVNTASQLTLAQRIDLDIYRRSLPMLPVFSSLWALIAWFTGFWSQHSALASSVLSLLLGIAAGQVLFGLLQAWLYGVAANLWRLCYYSLTFANGLLWAGLFAACFFEASFEVVFLPMTLATLAISNAALSNCTSRWVAVSYASVCYCLPVACLSSRDHLVLGAMVVAYWFYALLILQRFHGEYTAGFKTAEFCPAAYRTAAPKPYRWSHQSL